LDQNFKKEQDFFSVELTEYIRGWDRAEKEFDEDYRGTDFLSIITTPLYPPKEALTSVLKIRKPAIMIL
jgi:hypothetical protein